jgi:hypothetical protein
MGSFSKGLYLGVWVLDSQGISFFKVKGMPLRASAMRFMRANGEGVAEMRVSWSTFAAMIGVGFGMLRIRGVLFSSIPLSLSDVVVVELM